MQDLFLKKFAVVVSKFNQLVGLYIIGLPWLKRLSILINNKWEIDKIKT